ncbi:permease-like cell division protein FtsX [Thioalkalivibrio sp. XN279]|uniref:permease-like cell division protein FtsX n=1 Tax=Thioalkalivibrio sp. XN279 TaxID=2714953 RepID=UPI0014077A4C|nr:permease-like cell division protein FtsX [Thioalkalivibrio sp. XN279]NHA15688.1 ABC transporter permease [Thioalkalivibrio sp. XN279]
MPSRAPRPRARKGGPKRGRQPLLARLSALRLPRPALKWPRWRGPGLLRSWVRLHVQTLVGSLGRLAEQPVATAMTLAVIGIALALPASLYLLVNNLQGLSGHWEQGVELSVYLEPGQPEAQVRSLAADIEAWDEVAATGLITAAEALVTFRAESGLGDALGALEHNPLPHLITVRPAPDHDSPEAIEAMAERLRALPEADLVQADADWVRRLFAMLDIARRLATLAGVLLAVGVLVIVGNTIRLDIQNRRAEIEVMKLIGGTDGFIRRPLLYGGTWYGLGGALVALAIVQLGLWTLSDPVARLAGLYGSGFRPGGLGGTGALALLLLGAGLGWLGAWVSATRHLRRVEPGL